MIAANQTDSWLEPHADTQLLGSQLEWLNAQRTRALENFANQGLPGVRDEDWRYTNLRALKSGEYRLSESSALELDLPSSDFARVVIVDGHIDKSASSGLSSTGADNVVVASLEDVIQESYVESNFGSTLPDSQHGFTELNTAYAQDGFVVYMPKGSQLPNTLEVVFVHQNAAIVSHTRNLIIAEANTQCTIIERHIGKQDEIYLNNSVTEIIANDNAHIDHYKIQQESAEGFHIGGVFINQANSSQVTSHNIALTGLVTRNDPHGNEWPGVGSGPSAHRQSHSGKPRRSQLHQ